MKKIETTKINNNAEGMICLRATASDGTMYDKAFPAAQAPASVVLVKLVTTKAWQVLGWTVSEARAKSHMARVKRCYMGKAPVIELRYTAIEMVTPSQIASVEHKEDRSAFRPFSVNVDIATAAREAMQAKVDTKTSKASN